MLKYVGYDIVFREVPDEVSMAIDLSLCPHRCKGCHSAYLQQDVGQELTEEALIQMMHKYAGLITCVCLLGGDNDPVAVDAIAQFIRKQGLKVCWYSGTREVDERIEPAHFDYIKIGPYIDSFGPLDKPTTNQRLYHILSDGTFEDITPSMWKK